MSFKRVLLGGPHDIMLEDHNGNECCPIQALKDNKAWIVKANMGRRRKKIGYAICWFTIDITEDNADEFAPSPELMDFYPLEDYEADILANEAGVTIEDHSK